MPPPKKFRPVTHLKPNRIDLITALIERDKKINPIPMLTMKDLLREKDTATIQ